MNIEEDVEVGGTGAFPGVDETDVKNKHMKFHQLEAKLESNCTKHKNMLIEGQKFFKPEIISWLVENNYKLKVYYLSVNTNNLNKRAEHRGGWWDKKRTDKRTSNEIDRMNKIFIFSFRLWFYVDIYVHEKEKFMAFRNIPLKSALFWDSDDTNYDCKINVYGEKQGLPTKY